MRGQGRERTVKFELADLPSFPVGLRGVDIDLMYAGTGKDVVKLIEQNHFPRFLEVRIVVGPAVQ